MSDRLILLTLAKKLCLSEAFITYNLVSCTSCDRCAIFDCGKYYHPRCLVTPDHPQGLKSDHMETLAYVWYFL